MPSTVYVRAGKYIMKGVHEMIWTTSGAAGAGTPLDAPNLPDKTMYINGPSTGGGTSQIIIEGTNITGAPSVVPWITLTSPTDGLLDFTAMVTTAIMRVIRENPLRIRPRFAVVTTGETLSVVIISR
tara:strand:+ start:2666 stop:3046 length:381 start_codon:yes stop_codon:yes gene_type:complete